MAIFVKLHGDHHPSYLLVKAMQTPDLLVVSDKLM